MKKTIKILLLSFIVGSICFFISCKRMDIKGEVPDVNNITLRLKSDKGEINIPSKDTDFIKTPENVSIPIRILFSDAAPKRFNVSVSVDNDTINRLIAENKLPNTILLQEQYYKIPSNLDVRFGLDHLDFNLVIDITPIERNYGKNLALALVLNNPTKNNKLEETQREAIIMLNTSKIIKESEIHYIYFSKADTVLSIPQPGITYEQSTSYLTVPVDISLGGVPAGSFNVRLSGDKDTIQKLINKGVLKNVHPLTQNKGFLFPDSVNFTGKQSLAQVNLRVSVDSLVAHYNQKVALALSLDQPSSHLLDSSKRSIVVVLDPIKLVEFNITAEGVFSSQRENTRTSEVSTNLVDGKINTKFLLFDFRGVWVQLAYDTPVVAGAYTLTSANDNMTYTDRNINAWKLLGSNDGTHWTTLDTENGQPFTANYQTVKYYFNNSVAYKYYRLNIESVAGGPGALLQLAEWSLIRTPPR